MWLSFLLLLLATVRAEPVIAASSARTVTGETPFTFPWPTDAIPCRADLVLGPDGVATRVVDDSCGERLQALLDRLVGVAFVPSADGHEAVIEVAMVPPPEGEAAPQFRTLLLQPEAWPAKWPGDLTTVAANTQCAARLAFKAGEAPTAFTIEECPAPLAKALTKELAKAKWTARSAIPAPDGWSAQVSFVYVEDPMNSSRRLLLLQGHPLPKRMVIPPYPGGMMGGAKCAGVVHVEPTGAPSWASVGGCTPPWNMAARSALQKWTFWPGVVDGQPIAEDYLATIGFEQH